MELVLTPRGADKRVEVSVRPPNGTGTLTEKLEGDLMDRRGRQHPDGAGVVDWVWSHAPHTSHPTTIGQDGLADDGALHRLGHHVNPSFTWTGQGDLLTVAVAETGGQGRAVIVSRCEELHDPKRLE